MTSPSFARGGGIVPIAVLAAENGQTIAEAKKSLADLSAFGVVRLATGPEGETTRVKVKRYLTLVDEDGTAGCFVMFLARPAATLSPYRRRKLAEMLARLPGAPLGSLALMCGLVRLADSTGFVASAAIEDYLGWPRGAMDKDGEARLDP